MRSLHRAERYRTQPPMPGKGHVSGVRNTINERLSRDFLNARPRRPT